MASIVLPLRPLAGIGQVLRVMRSERQQLARRCYATAHHQSSKPAGLHNFHPGNIYRGHREQDQSARRIKTFPSTASAKTRCCDPIAAVTSSQVTILDPSGVRTRLFHKSNPERAAVGDVLLVRTKTGDPFSGVCINIRRSGIDTAILLRNQLTRVGVEMWFKIYSPNVTGIEVVQRSVRRVRRAKLYYMRNAKHDMGSVENITAQYLRKRSSLRGGSTGAKTNKSR